MYYWNLSNLPRIYFNMIYNNQALFLVMTVYRTRLDLCHETILFQNKRMESSTEKKIEDEEV